jgi:hypothetical protein
MSDDEYMASRKTFIDDLDSDVRCKEFLKDVWRRTYEYRGIKYDIAMMRYLSTSGQIGMNQYGKWFVLEHPKETSRIAEFVKEIAEYSEFLYKDTLHPRNDQQTFEQMFYEMVEFARQDIDYFLDDMHTEVEKRQTLLEEIASSIQSLRRRN